MMKSQAPGGATPGVCGSRLSGRASFVPPSVVVKVVYMQMILQCLLVWIALVRYRLAEPSEKQKGGQDTHFKPQTMRKVNEKLFFLTVSCVTLLLCHFLKVPDD